MPQIHHSGDTQGCTPNKRYAIRSCPVLTSGAPPILYIIEAIDGLSCRFVAVPVISHFQPCIKACSRACEKPMEPLSWTHRCEQIDFAALDLLFLLSCSLCRAIDDVARKSAARLRLRFQRFPRRSREKATHQTAAHWLSSRLPFSICLPSRPPLYSRKGILVLSHLTSDPSAPSTLICEHSLCNTDG